MKFKIETKLNDGLSEAPPIVEEIEGNSPFGIKDLVAFIEDEMYSDNGTLHGPGFTLTVERIE